MRTIIVGNSPEKSFEKEYCYQESDYLIGVDGGALAIIKKGYPLNLALGDFDSTTDFDLIKASCKKVLIYPKEKNETDLELAILKSPYNQIYIYDVFGGRLDHELLAIWLLAKYHDLDITMSNMTNQIKYLTKGTYQIVMNSHKYFSLLTKEKATITTKGSYYDLNQVTIQGTDTYTTSNEAKDNVIELIIHQGSLYLILS